MEMTRVAMLVINAFSHDTRVRKEAKSLHDAGYEVKVFALYGEGLSKEEIVDGYQVERIHVRSRGLGVALLIRLVKYLEFCVRAIHRIARFRPSIVHAHDVNALVPAYVTSRLCRAHLIYDAHELWAERAAPLLRANWLRFCTTKVEKILARRADRVITVNSSLADYLVERYQVRPPLVIMHSQEYEPVEHNDILRKELDIPRRTRIVIYAGVFLPGRGLEELISATPYLDQAVVVLMGPNRMGAKLSQLIEELDLQNRVFLHDPVPPSSVNYYVASADLGVAPTQKVDLSYYYALENKIFHYLTAGIPVVMSDHPEKRRLVETYGVGKVFDETDPVDIAIKINELLADEECYQEMCRRAEHVSRDIFNWQIESQKLQTFYAELLLGRDVRASKHR